MNSKQFVEIVEILKLDSSRLYKEDIVRKYWNNEKFKQLLEYIYDPNFLIGVKEKFTINTFINAGNELFDKFDEFLYIYTHSPHSKKTWKPFFDSLNYTSQLCFNMLIKKSMECGVDISTLNKIEPGFIFQMPCMLANTYNEKTSKYIKFPAIIQEKADGIRCNVVINNGLVTNLLSREGKKFDPRCIEIFQNDMNNIYVDNKISKIIKMQLNDKVLDGEIVFYNDMNQPLDRKTSNGLANKCIQHTITDEELKNIRFICWDIIDYDVFVDKRESQEGNYDVLMRGINHMFKTSNIIIPIQTYIVNNIDEVYKLYNQFVSEGKEGAMLKNINMKWENKRSNNMLKLKEFESMELLAVEFIEGIGKYEGMLGSIKCYNKEKNIVVNVGTGFDDEQRKSFWRNRLKLLNTVIEVGYNKIIQSKTEKHQSLYLPTFIKFRHDITL